MFEAGQIDQFTPPEARLKYIEQTGEVEISFDQDMQVLPDLSMINSGTVLMNGQDYPVVQIDVIAGPYSDPQMLDFDWVTSYMDERSVRFQLKFKNAIHVSANSEPDTLRVVFRDRFMFVGVNDLAIATRSHLWD